MKNKAVVPSGAWDVAGTKKNSFYTEKMPGLVKIPGTLAFVYSQHNNL